MKIDCVIPILLLASQVAGCTSTTIAAAPSPASSYACVPEQVKGSQVTGEGKYGCHFYLHHPVTHQLLADTAYRLDIYSAPANGGKPPPPVLSLDGKTDAGGRSSYVRAAFPMTPDKVKFVERIGSGPYSITPRILRPTDGLAIPHMKYTFDLCGKPYSGTTDERGNGTSFHTPEPCEVSAKFYR